MQSLFLFERLSHMHVNLRERDLNALCLKALVDCLEQIKVDLPIVGSLGPHAERKGQSAVALYRKTAEGLGIGKNQLVLGGFFKKDRLNTVDIASVCYTNVQTHAARAVNRVVNDRVAHNAAVGNGNSLVISRFEEGVKEGEERLSKLIQLLVKENRMREIERVTLDKEYREILYKEYNLR